MESVDLARFIFSFLGVIALILISSWIVKRLDVQKRLAGLRKDAHLAVVETSHIDNRHKLVVIRRDERHHLLLIGQAAPLLIESYDAPAQEAAHENA